MKSGHTGLSAIYQFHFRLSVFPILLHRTRTAASGTSALRRRTAASSCGTSVQRTTEIGFVSFTPETGTSFRTRRTLFRSTQVIHDYLVQRPLYTWTSLTRLLGDPESEKISSSCTYLQSSAIISNTLTVDFSVF